MSMENFSMEKKSIGFAVESSGPWGRIVKECEKNLAEKVAGTIALSVPEGDVDEIKMEAIQNTVNETMSDMFLKYAEEINGQTLGWTKELAIAPDIELAEKQKAEQLGEILGKSAGKDIALLMMEKM